MSEPVIELAGVSKVYAGGTRALRDASLQVEAGERCCLLGPNGAGKTTIMRLLDGALRPTSGEVRLFGQPARGSSLLAAKRHMGIVPQNPGMYTDLTVRDYLRFVRDVYQKGDVERTVDGLGLSSYLDRQMDALSGGYQRRLVLAAATLSEPAVLLLDEPTVGLDPLAASETRALLRSAMAGRTVLMCTHNLAEAEELCDTVIIIREGRVLIHETIAALRLEALPRIHLAAREGPMALGDALGRLEIDAVPQDNGATFPLERPEHLLPDLLRRLLEQDINIYECRIDTPSLEELFVGVVTSR